MSEGHPSPPPRGQEPAPGQSPQPYGDDPQQAYREPQGYGDQQYREQGYGRAPLAAAPAGYASTTTTVVDAKPVGPAPALMLALGLLIGLLIGLVIAYAIWHSA